MGSSPSRPSRVQPSGSNNYSYGNIRFRSDGRRRLIDHDFWWNRPPYSNVPDNSGRADASVAITKDVDLHKAENQFNHRTDQYDIPELIVRRGQSFKMTLTMDRDYDPANDKLILHFTTGARPMNNKNTLVNVQPGGTLASSEWGASEESYSGKTVTFNVMIAADAVVGAYTLFVLTSYEDQDGKKTNNSYKHLEEFYILFNAWCEEDTVYLENEEERQEYVMNENGRIWQSSRWYSKPWYFGQFESVCLRASLKLLESSYLDNMAHGNPIQVIRALSAKANSFDGGVLTGNWSGNYEGGTSPTAWIGSHKILKEFMAKTNENVKDVKYGQCWVFSGLLTTLCRTLGIPTRSVTNHDSAHDSNESMTIDNHVDKDGKPVNVYGYDNDSVWNFHVWNEAWMKRPELPTGTSINSNDGWQAFDSTPQETSDGMMRCGPAPVNAIKRGDVFLAHDAKFIFAEVNGDKITWEREGFEFRPIKIERSGVGTNILTKQVGNKSVLNLTENYKYKEGTDEEREVVKKVSKYSSRSADLADVYNIENGDVDIKFESKPTGDKASSGDFEFVFTATNKSNDSRNLAIRLHTAARYYTGEMGEELMSHKEDVGLKPDATETVVWHMKASEWMNTVASDAKLGVTAWVKVKETGQTFIKQNVQELDKPELTMTASAEKIPKGQELEVTIQFKNPLSIPLTNTVILIEGPGIDAEKNIAIRNIKPDEEIKRKVKLVPKKKGLREVIGTLNSRQLTGIDGSVAIEVTEE